MRHLFTYGTLMCPDIFHSVTGLTLPAAPGMLREYSRHPVIGELYPGIRPKSGSMVRGIVYRNVPVSAWLRLDLFEGEMYERRPVHIEDEHGAIIPADTYVIRPEHIHCLGKHDWSFRQFLAAGKDSFQNGYPGYSAAGKPGQEEQ